MDTAESRSTILGSLETRPDNGIPLGNLTSQLFANIYLNRLDRMRRTGPRRSFRNSPSPSSWPVGYAAQASPPKRTREDKAKPRDDSRAVLRQTPRKVPNHFYLTYRAKRSQTRALTAVPPAGIEPTLPAPQASVLSVERRGLLNARRVRYVRCTVHGLRVFAKQCCTLQTKLLNEAINERVCVRAFFDVGKQKRVHRVRVHALKRNHEVRRKQTVCFYGKYRRN